MIISILSLGLSGGAFLYEHLTQPINVPVLQPYTSELLGGGQSPDSVCVPVREKYAKEYPGFEIGVQAFEASTFDNVKYQYKCQFIARPKR